jgi:hypothetical protein
MACGTDIISATRNLIVLLALVAGTAAAQDYYAKISAQ